jgi:hypothetical protein
LAGIPCYLLFAVSAPFYISPVIPVGHLYNAGDDIERENLLCSGLIAVNIEGDAQVQ